MRFDSRLDPLIEEIASKVYSCTRCDLAESRLSAVPGEGPQNAEIMFIGEAPGAKEDEIGRPFVGQSGKFLTELLQEGGFKREDVFITSILKCRPPENRNPKDEEIRSCAPYLLAQVDSISPKIIVTLGNFAYDLFSTTFYLPKKSIGEIHGKVFRLHSTKCGFLIPTYHPAGLMYNRKLVPSFKEDLATVKRYLTIDP